MLLGGEYVKRFFDFVSPHSLSFFFNELDVSHLNIYDILFTVKRNDNSASERIPLQDCF